MFTKGVIQMIVVKSQKRRPGQSEQRVALTDEKGQSISLGGAAWDWANADLVPIVPPIGNPEHLSDAKKYHNTSDEPALVHFIINLASGQSFGAALIKDADQFERWWIWEEDTDELKKIPAWVWGQPHPDPEVAYIAITHSVDIVVPPGYYLSFWLNGDSVDGLPVLSTGSFNGFILAVPPL